MAMGLPGPKGLYDPATEKDSCGVGFVADIRGRASHQLVEDGGRILEAMEHRGASGAEPNTGDGAGILTALPHRFLARVASLELGAQLPEPGRFAAGLVFLPTDRAARDRAKEAIRAIVEGRDQRLIGFRPVPTDPDGADLGPTARAAMPVIEQVFVGAAEGQGRPAFERELYVIRKRMMDDIRGDDTLPEREMFYVCSLSTTVVVYKGMLTAWQLLPFFPDLRDPDFETHLAMVHSRFSTNTFPSWDRAQPLRFMSHNGEINTVRGNKNWMRAREGMASSSLYRGEMEQLFPVLEPDTSDSGAFDNVLELLTMTGRSLPEAIMMMLPEAWEGHEEMSASRRAFYEYHSCLMEPWDGPASIAFTDGSCIGAVLDRNGLRPSRYYVTDDDKVIMASEVGVLPVAPESVREKGRLEPGRMFLVDFEQGRLVPDDELKARIAGDKPYQEWLESGRVELMELPVPGNVPGFEPSTLLERMRAAGYTSETLEFLLVPMIAEQRDPVGSMGNDSALAVLSDKPRLVYDYFKQLFAQVTNPAIDSIREECIMSLECYVGPEGNLLEAGPEHARRIRLPHPILTNRELAQLARLEHRSLSSRTIDTTYPRSEGADGLEPALRRIAAEVEAAADAGAALVVLSDRNAGREHVAVSALLATGAAHQHLVRQAKRTRVGLVVETAEAREVHHHCLLVGYGADAINPYLAFEALYQARRDELLPAELATDEAVEARYLKACKKGMLKVLAKMGISTLRSYKGAQIFEAVGLGAEVMDSCFTGTASRLAGVGFDVLATEALRRQELAYPRRAVAGRLPMLPNDGQFHYRAGGERHMWDPAAIADIQEAARKGDPDAYRRFAAHANGDARTRCTLRGLLRFRTDDSRSVPLGEVEPASEIVKRFATGAMSFGSISAEAHESLAVAMNRLGGKSNTGEGGEDPKRYLPLAGGASNPKRSAIKQIASGRFGVTINYLTNADELQIKIAQGAKPGEGGELPGRKVDETIARIRHSTPGVGLISPPPHHDIYSIEDLAQLIFDLKNANPSARISVKLVSEVGVGTVAAGVTKAHAEHLLISGHDGGTGASPLTSIKHAGLPWELGVAETHQTLVLNDLRSRVVIQTDGQLKTGRDVVIAALLGAEEYGFSTAPLITLGCIMMRKCHLNTCPVGIATQDPVLRKRFAGQPEHVVSYLFMVAEEARELMAELGFRTVDEMIGRVDRLEANDALQHFKADGLDLTALLTPAQRSSPTSDVRCTQRQDHGLATVLDQELIRAAEVALQGREKIRLERPIRNTDRATGTMLSHEVARRHGEALLPEDSIHVKLSGSAGQSFGAWLAKGITFELEGDANDYVGKGLSGGRIVVYPSESSPFAAEDNVLVGNVVLYGAVSGEAYFRGRAAERFAVRNSGARAVVEGVGDHGCEYMTGGRVLVLGSIGRNFAAGMSGGIAYLWDREGALAQRVNRGLVELERVEPGPEVREVRALAAKHLLYTGSPVAADFLRRWGETSHQLIKVMPRDYKRALERRSPRSSGTPHGGRREVAHG